MHVCHKCVAYVCVFVLITHLVVAVVVVAVVHVFKDTKDGKSLVADLKEAWRKACQSLLCACVSCVCVAYVCADVCLFQGKSTMMNCWWMEALLWMMVLPCFSCRCCHVFVLLLHVCFMFFNMLQHMFVACVCVCLISMCCQACCRN